MVLKIRQYGDPVLRKRTPKLEKITDEIHALANDMLETMQAARGVGLAAPQVGVLERMAIVDVSHDPESCSYIRVNGKDVELSDVMPLIFINPELTLQGGKEKLSEGCLSIQGIRANVSRAKQVKAELTLPDGSEIVLETDGLFAQALQHETDHLNGVLFVDRLSPSLKIRLKSQLRKLTQEYEEGHIT